MTHPLILRVTQDGVTPTIEGPAPEAVISGNSVHTTWSLEETADGLYCGMWQATPGKWRLTYAEWEYVYIHEGHSILTDENGVETHLKAGDSYIIRPGYSGTWEVVETTLKDYVIKA